MHEGLIEVESKKWPKEKAFIIFRERNKFFVVNKLTGQRSSGFGAQIMKNLNRVWAWRNTLKTKDINSAC